MSILTSRLSIASGERSMRDWRTDGMRSIALTVDATTVDQVDGRQLIEGSAVDITGRRRAEHRARAARIEADRANRAKSDFLSRMSHELRTPLNSIIGFSQLLEMRDLGDRDLEGVKQIHRAGKHLLTLINEVLDIARVESGRLEVSVEPVELKPLIANAIELMRPMADTRNLDIHIDDVDGVWAMADQQRLKQVLLNLLSNAVKYNQGQLSISMEYRRKGSIRMPLPPELTMFRDRSEPISAAVSAIAHRILSIPHARATSCGMSTCRRESR